MPTRAAVVEGRERTLTASAEMVSRAVAGGVCAGRLAGGVSGVAVSGVAVSGVAVSGVAVSGVAVSGVAVSGVAVSVAESWLRGVGVKVGSGVRVGRAVGAAAWLPNQPQPASRVKESRETKALCASL
jgi:hypothetical protein